VALATEDVLSEAVGKRLLACIEHPLEPTLYFRQNGFGYLRANMDKWCKVAAHQPVVLLTDLDNHVCPQELIADWSGALIRPNNLIFRVAVKEVESWLLADHEAMRHLIGEKGKLPSEPDNLDDPKKYLLDLDSVVTRYLPTRRCNECGRLQGMTKYISRSASQFLATA